MWIFIYNFLAIARQIIELLIFVRVILSWFNIQNRYIYDTTEWLLGPCRKIIPPIGGVLDLSPIIAVVVIEFLFSFLMSVVAYFV